MLAFSDNTTSVRITECNLQTSDAENLSSLRHYYWLHIVTGLLISN